MQKLSIVIPVYNEEKTVSLILDLLCKVKLPGGLKKEIILVNDCSTDNSEQIINQFIIENKAQNIKYYCADRNRGKGASLHKGIAHASGDYIVIQDADLEYDPNEYARLLDPLLQDKADVVYGSRFVGGRPHRILFFWHTIGNKFLTFLSNLFTNLNLTDMETCYKIFRAPMLKSLDLKECRFGFEPEVTAKMSRIPGVRIYEVGISYYGRTYEEGKKINWKDGFRALWCIVKYNVFAK